MKCCLFHDNGGPLTMGCDDYGLLGGDGATSCEVDHDNEPVVRLQDVDDWDAYAGDAEAESAAAASDAGEVVAAFD